MQKGKKLLKTYKRGLNGPMESLREAWFPPPVGISELRRMGLGRVFRRDAEYGVLVNTGGER